MLWWFALAALADDPVPAEPTPVDDAPTVIIVEGHRVTAARDALLHDLGDQGYDRVKDKGDHFVLKSDQPYKGRVFVYDDGWVTMKVPKTVQMTRLSFAGVGIGGGFNLFPTHGAIASIEEGALGPTQAAVARFGDRVADAAVEARANALPAKLFALWERGVPLDDGPTLASTAERKAAILAYWESRTDTVWGDRIRAAVDAFLRAEVQTGDDAFTPAEITAFNGHRRCERELDLSPDRASLSSLTDPS